MKVFRSHLHDFESRGKRCSPCSRTKPRTPAHTRGMEISDMMNAKFARSSRHTLWAWVTFMIILLLAFIYIDNTKWNDTWFRTPTHYNISALLEEDASSGMDDDMVLTPSDAAGVGNVAAKGKAGKKQPAAVDSVVVEQTVEDSGADQTQKTAKAVKVAKEGDIAAAGNDDDKN